MHSTIPTVAKAAGNKSFLLKQQLRNQNRSFIKPFICPNTLNNQSERSFHSSNLSFISADKAVSGRYVNGALRKLNFTHLKSIENPAKDPNFALPEQEIDPIEQSEIAQKFINLYMKNGEKQRAIRRFKRSLRVIKAAIGNKVHLSPLTILEKAVLNCTPHFNIIAYRYRGLLHIRPQIVDPGLLIPKVIRWFMHAAKKIGLSQAILQAYFRRGPVYRRCFMINFMAFKNRKYILPSEVQKLISTKNNPTWTQKRTRKGDTTWVNKFVMKIYGSHTQTKFKGMKQFSKNRPRNKYHF